jgi:hypothetical protein
MSAEAYTKWIISLIPENIHFLYAQSFRNV